MSDASSGDLAPVTFYPRRDMMLGLYGLAMIAVLAGIILVMVPTILAPGRVGWLLIPAVVFLLAGIAMAGLGQLAMFGNRCIVRFDAARWVVRPILGRSRTGAWTDVDSVGRRDDAPDQLVITLADGASLGLATRWLDAKPSELEDAVRVRLDRANGYRTVEQAIAEQSERAGQPEQSEQAGHDAERRG
jgi:hypothetical protein